MSSMWLAAFYQWRRATVVPMAHFGWARPSCRNESKPSFHARRVGKKAEEETLPLSLPCSSGDSYSAKPTAPTQHRTHVLWAPCCPHHLRSGNRGASLHKPWERQDARTPQPEARCCWGDFAQTTSPLTELHTEHVFPPFPSSSFFFS